MLVMRLTSTILGHIPRPEEAVVPHIAPFAAALRPPQPDLEVVESVLSSTVSGAADRDTETQP
jgi:hypothetical protein